jgi:hypothetical protein
MFLFCIAFSARRRIHRVPRRHRDHRRQHGDQHRADHGTCSSSPSWRSRTASQHPEGSRRLPPRRTGTPIDFVVAQEPVVADGKPKVDDSGQPVMQDKMDDERRPRPRDEGRAKPVPYHALSYAGRRRRSPMDPGRRRSSEGADARTFSFTPHAGSVVAPHSFSYIFIQACIAILILGRIRIGDLDGGGGKERQARRPPCRPSLARYSGHHAAT